MQVIQLKNILIVPVFNLLNEAELKNKASRGRNKFLKRLEEKNKDFNDDLNDIRKDFFKTDSQGELVYEDGVFLFKDEVLENESKKEELSSRIMELENEEFEISFVEHSSKYKALFEALDTFDESLSGEKAIAYDELMDAYEKTEEEE